jgi:hypothetical protein
VSPYHRQHRAKNRAPVPIMNVALRLTPRWWKSRRHGTTLVDPDAQVSRWKDQWLAGATAAWSGEATPSNPHNAQRAGLEHAAWQAGFKWARENPDRRHNEDLRLAHPHRRASDARLATSLKRAAALGATGVALYAASRALRRWRGSN